MAGFVYYIPNVRQAPHSVDLLPGDLGKTLGKTSIETREVNVGPDNMKGFVIASQPSSPKRRTRVGYYPKEQKWVVASGYWIGWNKDDPPGPYDLQKEDYLEGYNVKLCDKREWVTPIILGKFSTVQMGFKIEGDDLEYVVASGYEEIVRKAEALKKATEESVSQDDAVKIIDFDMLKYAVELLGMHYKIGLWESSIACLSLLDPVTVWVVLWAAIDGKRSE